MNTANRKVKSFIPPDQLVVFLYEDLTLPNSESYAVTVKTARGCKVEPGSTVTLATDVRLADGNTALVRVLGISALACIKCPARPKGEGFRIGRETCRAYVRPE